MVGTGHTFTAIAVADDLLLRPDGLRGDRRGGPRRDDRHRAGRHAAARAQRACSALGLALHNMGDIDRQTVAGAIATGTHGTGGARPRCPRRSPGSSWSPATGRLLRAIPRRRTPTSSTAARVGLGALGIVTAVTFRVEPAFVLEADEQPMAWAEVVDGVRRPGRGEPARRDVLVPAHRPDADQAQQPARRRPREAAALPVAGVRRRRAALQHRVRPAQPRRQPASRRGTAHRPAGRRGCCPPAPTPTSPTGCSPRRGGWSSGRWSTPSRGRPGMPALTEAGR